MNSTLTPPMNPVEPSTVGAFVPIRSATLVAACLRRFVLMMSQSGGGSPQGSPPGTTAPADGGDKKKDNGESTSGTKPMDPPTIGRSGIAPAGLRAALERLTHALAEGRLGAVAA